MNDQKVFLKKGKEKALKNRHHWIFSGAVERLPDFQNGDILPVCSHAGELLGYAYFNRKAGIVGRMVSFGNQQPLDAIRRHIQDAQELRRHLFEQTATTGFRLINGEGDFLPGLIVDRYGDILVMQISTLGMEKLRPFVIETLVECCNPKAIYEKSVLPSRKEEGLHDVQGFVYGTAESEVGILENGLKFSVSFIEGQKTGFFLDHREMRSLIQQLAKGKRVLNCFCYTGGFSLYAARGGAVEVDSVDISEKAIKMAEHHFELNGFSKAKARFLKEDVFAFLRQNPLDYEIVILDPPAFAKRQKDVISACRGYKDINRMAMQKMPPRSLLLTCSCSYHVDEALFQKVIFQAAIEANRAVRIIGRHFLASDHPINICHPEGDYLKSLLLYIE